MQNNSVKKRLKENLLKPEYVNKNDVEMELKCIFKLHLLVKAFLKLVNEMTFTILRETNIKFSNKILTNIIISVSRHHHMFLVSHCSLRSGKK